MALQKFEAGRLLKLLEIDILRQFLVDKFMHEEYYFWILLVLSQAWMNAKLMDFISVVSCL
jgi:hypothetical protein